MSLLKSEITDAKPQTKKGPTSWENILMESSEQSKFEDKYVIVLGKRGSGKRSLLDSLHSISQTKFPHDTDDRNPGKLRVQNNVSAMDYIYLNVLNLEDQDDETMTNMSFFIIDDISHKDLLKSVINIDNLSKCLIVIMLNLEEPWNVLQDFNEWYNLLTEIVQDLKIPLAQYDQLKENLKQKVKKSRVNFQFNNEDQKQDQESEAAYFENLPLGEGVLNHNIGLPIVLLCNKSDLIESQDVLKETKKLDFLQFHLRKLAIEYGASLLFTSTRSNLNLDQFYKFAVQQLYQFRIELKPEFQNPDQLFIPIGSDNLKMLRESYSQIDQAAFEDVIKKPDEKLNLQQNTLIIKSEQEFLQSLKEKYVDSVSKIKTDTPIFGQEHQPSQLKGLIGQLQTQSGQPENYQTLSKSQSINIAMPQNQKGDVAAPSSQQAEQVKIFYQNLLQSKNANAAASDQFQKASTVREDPNVQKTVTFNDSGDKKAQVNFSQEDKSKIMQLLNNNKKKPNPEIITKKQP